MDKDKQLEELRSWLMDNMPQTPVEKRTLNFVTNKERQKILRKKINVFNERCRITQQLISRIAIKTSINKEDVNRGANTILEMIEKELTKGYKVIIEHFGEFSLKRRRKSDYDVGIVFKSDDIWLKGFNDPINKKELGLGKKLPIKHKRKLRKLT